MNIQTLLLLGVCHLLLLERYLRLNEIEITSISDIPFLIFSFIMAPILNLRSILKGR